MGREFSYFCEFVCLCVCVCVCVCVENDYQCSLIIAIEPSQSGFTIGQSVVEC